MPDDLIVAVLRAPEPPALAPREWEDLLAQARRSRLLARLAWRLATQGWLAGVPPGPRLHLEGALQVVRRQIDQVRWELDRIDAALARLQVPVVLLKGAAYIAADLPPARGRLFADVDILVPKEALRRVESALMAGGWIAERLDAYDERYYRDWMHELPPLQHVQRHTHLDVHHTITPPTSRFPVDGAALIAAARPLHDGSVFHVLAPTDQVLHSAVHLMQEGEFDGGLRDLMDIDDLLQYHGRGEPAFWIALAGRAQALGLAVPLAHVLYHLERLFGTRAPPAAQPALAALHPRGPRRWLMNRLLAAALRPDHPRCTTAWTRPARLALYVRSHWLRMPWYQILPHLMRKGWMRAQARRADARKKRDAQLPAA